MQTKPWIDQNGNYRCESCGKTVVPQELQWEKGLGYCSACYQEISEEKTDQSDSQSAIGIVSSIKSLI